jgi:hypothetical protein
MGKYAVLMFADPAHTRAMSESALVVVARKHAMLREELTESGELPGGSGTAVPERGRIFRSIDERRPVDHSSRVITSSPPSCSPVSRKPSDS